MLAITFHGVRSVRAESVPDPRILDPRDALVRVTKSAVCGSDLHPYHGREVGLDVGTVLGHEFAGVVEEVGGDVATLEPGVRVASPFTTSCGACFFCRRGLTCRCVGGSLFGWVEGGRGLHGAQAERVRVPLADATLVRVPDGVDDESAVLAGDVLATGSFGAELGEVSAETVVAVIGCGPVGLCAVAAARRRGAPQVFALDREPARLALAAQLGGSPVDVSAGDARAVVFAATDGRGADVVIEAVGSEAAARAAYALIRFGGTIAAVGVHTEPQFAFSPGAAYDRNLTYRAGRCPARRFLPGLLEDLRARRFDLSSLFSHRFPLADGARAYDVFDRKIDGCTKVLLEP